MLGEMYSEFLPSREGLPTKFTWLVLWFVGSFVIALIEHEPGRFCESSFFDCCLRLLLWLPDLLVNAYELEGTLIVPLETCVLSQGAVRNYPSESMDACSHRPRISTTPGACGVRFRGVPNLLFA